MDAMVHVSAAVADLLNAIQAGANAGLGKDFGDVFTAGVGAAP